MAPAAVKTSGGTTNRTFFGSLFMSIPPSAICLSAVSNAMPLELLIGGGGPCIGSRS
jgi:hypothetical protein